MSPTVEATETIERHKLFTNFFTALAFFGQVVIEAENELSEKEEGDFEIEKEMYWDYCRGFAEMILGRELTEEESEEWDDIYLYYQNNAHNPTQAAKAAAEIYEFFDKEKKNSQQGNAMADKKTADVSKRKV